MGALLNNIQNLGNTQRLALVVVAIAIIAGLGFLSFRLAEPPMSLLFAGMDPEASGMVVQQLDQMGVPYEIAGESAIMVPVDQVARLRMILAGEGLPGGGPVGYELFDGGGALGITRFQEDMQYLRALEGELARSIRTVEGVAKARVHLVLPKREAFSRDVPTPTASVLVVMKGAATLDRDQVMAIQYLVAQAVPRMKSQAVSVIDQQGNLLTSSTEGESNTARADGARAMYEARISQSIESMLEPHLGAGKVRVSVSADLDLNRQVIREQIFDPEGQIARSTQTSSDTQSSTTGAMEDVVGVAGNLPDAAVGAADEGRGESSTSTRKDETVNYEISGKTLETVRESGAVKKLSVAVVVDGTTSTDGEGQRQYQPRTPEELAEIERAVKAAIGFDAERGDKVEVVNLPFVGGDVVDGEIPESGILDYFTANALILVQWATLAVIAIMLVLFGVRPLVANLFKPGAVPVAAITANQTDAIQSTSQGAITAGGMDSERLSPARSPVSLQRAERIVTDQPDAAAGIIRQWVGDGAA